MATVYQSSIDDEQINGAFALAVDVRFDDLGAGSDQKVFDLNNGDGVDNIWFGQVGDTNDVEFVIINNGVEHRIEAQDALVEGEYATWRVGVDQDGTMRIAKNTELLAEQEKGSGAVPVDVDRVNYQIGESSDPTDTDLNGLVLNLKLANYGNVDELDPTSQESPCAVTGEASCLCDKLYPDGIVEPGQPGIVNISNVDPEGDGEWSAPQSQGIIAIHSMVLPDGKVLSFGTNEDGTQGAQFVYSLYDPETGVDKILPNTTGTDIFCSSMSIDPATGNVLIMGGDQRGEGGTTNWAVNDLVVFDYRTETIRPAEQGEMNYARWYGTSINLPNGDILHLGGKDDFGGVSTIPEVFNSETGSRSLTGVNMTDLGGGGYYPHAWVNSRGEVIILESTGRDMFRLSTEGIGSYEKIGTYPFDSAKQQPSIMFDQDMVARVDNYGGIWIANIADEPPVFERVAELGDGRFDAGMTVLPDGTVAITGGGISYNDLATAHYDTVIWDPKTNELESVADLSLARLYHSSHILLPDGTVFVGGGGAPGPLTNTNFEVYAPSYLYDDDGNLADRPDIIDAPSNVEAGSAFQMTVEDASAISDVTVVKSGAQTHGRNSDARFLSLDFTIIDDTTVEVQTPNNFVMTPGAWMLFAIDDDGVPSGGEMLGVDMAELVDTSNSDTTDMDLAVYGIDDDQIDGAFSVTLEARFDELEGRSFQRVFDFGNGPGQDNIILTQADGTNDLLFQVFVDGSVHTIRAENAIDEDVVAKWTAAVDDGGYMRLWKNDVLVAEGQGAVPADVDRELLVGKSHWSTDDDLKGEVRFLEIVNEGDEPEYVHLGLPTASLTIKEDADNAPGELTFVVTLSEPAFNIVTADVFIDGNASGPSEIVIPAGQSTAEIIVKVDTSATGSDNETVTVSLDNLSQAWATTDLTVSGEIALGDTDVNLVANGSFEEAEVTSRHNWGVFADGEVPGWSSNTGTMEFQANGHGFQNAAAGDQWLELDNDLAVDSVYQDIQTEAGKTYELSFESARRADTMINSNSIEVYWNGSLIDTAKASSNEWETFTLEVTGTGGADRLEFREPASDNDRLGSLIDNVVLKAVEDSKDTVNTAPAASDDTATVKAGEALAIDVLANDSDIDGDVLTITSFSAPSNGTAAIDDSDTADTSDDRIVYTPDAGFVGTDTLTYSVTDGTEFSTATVTVTVEEKDDNLVANGSFEEAEVTSRHNWGVFADGEVPGWSSNTGTMEFQANSHGFQNAAAGDQWLELDNDLAVDSVYQDIQTEAGKTYELSFESARRADTTINTNSIEVYWNGSLIDTAKASSNEWETFTFEVTGTGGADRLEFREPASDNDRLGSLIDNVVLKAADKPVDQSLIEGTMGSDVITGTSGNDVILAGDGRDVINGTAGDDIIDGQGGFYNQVDYEGALADYTITQNTDGTVSVSHPDYGTDTLSNIDGFWFKGEGEWYSMADALVSNGADGLVHIADDSGGYVVGTTGNDVFKGGAGNDTFYGGKGNDSFEGGAGGYDQVDLDGGVDDYTFTRNVDGTVTATSAEYGEDVLKDIDGIWFYGDSVWAQVDDLIS